MSEETELLTSGSGISGAVASACLAMLKQHWGFAQVHSEAGAGERHQNFPLTEPAPPLPPSGAGFSLPDPGVGLE
jgi:hypothetical protein